MEGPLHPPCKLSERLRPLWDFLSDAKWEDGVDRQLGTLMILVEDGLVKAWVHDRDASCSAWVSADSLQGLLEAVSRGLEKDSLEWRKDRPSPARKR